MHLVSSEQTPPTHVGHDLLLMNLKASVVAHLYFIGTASGMWWPQLPAPQPVALLPYYRRVIPSYLRLVVNNK